MPDIRKTPVTGCLPAWSGLLLASMMILTGCLSSSDAVGPPAGDAVEAVPVAVVTVALENRPVVTELSGRVVASTIAEVRPQVSGIVAERLFVEGAQVQQGDLLYRIRDDRYRALWRQAGADLAVARAGLASAEISLQRYARLVGQDGVSQHEYELSKAAVELQQAEVLAREATLKTAEIDLQQTQIRAPVAGVIGWAEVNQGALVSIGQSTALARIQQLDPVYVDLQLPGQQLLAMKRRQHADVMAGHTADTRVQLLLDDGLPYEHDGELTFSGSRLDTSTDMVMLRVRFANPEGLLVPGMFVRAQLTLGQQQLVARLPQQAVSFDEHGQPVAWVIRDNKAEQQVLQLLDSRPLADSRHQWLVQQGLVDGSQVVTEGSMRLYPGATVMSTDWQAPEERLASDSPDHGGQP